MLYGIAMGHIMNKL